MNSIMLRSPVKSTGAKFSFAELRGFSQQALEDRLQIARESLR